jgi:hypothetical protein
MPEEGSVGCFASPINHTDEERNIFTEVQKNYYAADRASHFRYVEKVTDLLESRFRLFLYITVSLLFGEEACISLMPQATKKYATKNSDRRINHSTFFNPYNGLTRPQFRELFLSVDKVKKFIVDELDLRWQKSDWDLFFDVFIDENIATSHKQVDSYSPGDRDKYLNYCKIAKQLTAAINTSIRRLISKNAFVLLLDSTSAKSVEDAILKYSFKMDKSCKENQSQNGKIIGLDSKVLYRQDELYEHSLNSNDYNKVIACIFSKLDVVGFYLEDLMDVDYITGNYDISYCQFISVLTHAKNIVKSVEIYPWYGSFILIKKAPNLINQNV